MLKRHSPQFKAYDTVRIYFPYSDKPKSKYRPAVILSQEHFNIANGKVVVAMLTAATHSSWTFDTKITNYLECGLDKPSFVRFKLFTLKSDLIEKPLGRLSPIDRLKVAESFNQLFKDLTIFDTPPSPEIQEVYL